MKREIIWSGHEDWTGLWEIVWSLQTEYPDLRGTPARDEARKLLEELLRCGSVYLCLFDEDTNSETMMPEQEALAVLARDESWEPPQSPKGQFRFATTAEGVKPLLKQKQPEASS